MALEIIVVDNDSCGSAGEVVQDFSRRTKWSVRYLVEPERSIPLARNRAIEVATGQYIAIIDDDEIAPPEWILNLIRALETFEVDGALGPVEPIFDDRPPAWLLRSRLCERPMAPTGTLLDWSETRTGNVLFRRDLVGRLGLRFNPSLRTGGSDREFFRRAMAQGCRLISVRGAPVYEIVPPERWTAAYWVKRGVLNGFNASVIQSRSMGRVLRLGWVLRLGISALVLGLAALCMGVLGKHRLVPVLERVAHHFSRACGLCGIELLKRREI